jgi:predicted RNA methylase
MAVKTVPIPDDVRVILMRATIEPRAVILNDDAIDRALYTKVDKVLKAAGGKWNKSLKCHQFPEGGTDQLRAAVAGEEAIVDVKKTLEQFYTPRALAAEMLNLLDMGERDDLILLEPSAGQGAIVDAALSYGASVVAVEIDPNNVAALTARAAEPLGEYLTVIEGDFLTIGPVTPASFDRVAMNPPFSGGKDIEHVLIAYNTLKPGGKLVAIMGSGAFTNSHKRCTEFREWLKTVDGHTVTDIPPGAFKESGTMVGTVMLYLPKPLPATRVRVRVRV